MVKGSLRDGGEMNWKREVAHLTGGVIVGIVAQSFTFFGHDIGVIARIWIGLMLFGVIVTKEIIEDSKSQTRLKTYLDAISWIVGFLLVAVW